MSGWAEGATGAATIFLTLTVIIMLTLFVPGVCFGAYATKRYGAEKHCCGELCLVYYLHSFFHLVLRLCSRRELLFGLLFSFPFHI